MVNMYYISLYQQIISVLIKFEMRIISKHYNNFHFPIKHRSKPILTLSTLVDCLLVKLIVELSLLSQNQESQFKRKIVHKLY